MRRRGYRKPLTIPVRAIMDAKLLMRWHKDNPFYGDEAFAERCSQRYGAQVFRAACAVVEHVPRPS